MRRLFIVGAKILGLLCLWWAIFITLQTISFGSTFFGGWNRDSYWAIAALLYGGGLLAYFVLAVCFALVLLFRTEWIADKVRLDKDTELPGWPDERKLLSLGIVLLGFYVLAHAIPGVAKSSLSLLGVFWRMWTPGYRDIPTFFLQYVIPVFRDVLEVAVGLLLILMPSRIIHWLEKAQNALQRKLTKPQPTIGEGES
jgi:hypothetical protein